jgi:hypothetical protein
LYFKPRRVRGQTLNLAKITGCVKLYGPWLNGFVPSSWCLAAIRG